MQSDHGESETDRQCADSAPFSREMTNQSFEELMEEYNMDAQHVLGTPVQGDQIGTGLPSIHSTPSIVSTPDSATFSYTQNTSAYPSPTTQWLHPYSLNYQSASPALTPTSAHRPIHYRANTATSIQHLPPPFTPGYTRRRSLSHGDIDRLATPLSNPTFVRLQAPRYHTPDEHKSRRYRIEDVSSENSFHNNSDHGALRRGRPYKSHMPYALNGIVQVGGMQLTSIGTPINAYDLEQDSGCATEDFDGYGNRFNRRTSVHPDSQPPPVLQHMTRLEDIQRSNHIIQIGMMAIRSDPKIDPALLLGESDGHLNHIERAINRLDEAADHLKRDGTDNDALAVCAALKEDLQKKANSWQTTLDDLFAEGEASKHDKDAPSHIMGDNEGGAFAKSMTGTDLESMLREGYEGVEADE